MSKVLVTGGSGFVGSRVILQLLAGGHEVRTTVRSLSREAEVRAMLLAGGATAADRLTFFAADLSHDAGWADAVAGCDYVLHVASPFPASVPKTDDELIVPARDGALRVLRAARDARVRRVVMTSSFAAIGYGHEPRTTPFDESDWSNLEAPGVSAYTKSKAIAERAAWDFMAREGGSLELAVINPTGIFGPVLGADIAASTLIVQRMLNGAMPGCPDLYFGIVDVRDVADLHIRAMTDPAAAGERFLAVAGKCLSLHDVAVTLKRRLPAAATKVSTRRIPTWVMRIMALFSPVARQFLPDLGWVKDSSNAKAVRVLGWTPRSSEDAVVATAESLIALGLVTTG